MLSRPTPRRPRRPGAFPRRAALCAPWLEQELALIDPKVLIPIGGLAISRFLGNGQPMTGLIGKRFERDGRILVPLPHPSGASQCSTCGKQGAIGAGAGDLTELREQFGNGTGMGAGGNGDLPLPISLSHSSPH